MPTGLGSRPTFSCSHPNWIRGASPPRTPFAFARGAPRSPLRSGGRARGAPSPLCGQQQRVQSSRFEPQNGLTRLNVERSQVVLLAQVQPAVGDDRRGPRRIPPRGNLEPGHLPVLIGSRLDQRENSVL